MGVGDGVTPEIIGYVPSIKTNCSSSNLFEYLFSMSTIDNSVSTEESYMPIPL